jgi:methylated-DNA-protein-cysteine methyltransferase-like protein
VEKSGPGLDFTHKVWHVVRQCPRGRVVSYGGVAALLGYPRAARGVGRALAALPDQSNVPWWRVINRNGEISIRSDLHAPALQRALLEREGVRFNRRGRINWRDFGWDGALTDPIGEDD